MLKTVLLCFALLLTLAPSSFAAQPKSEGTAEARQAESEEEAAHQANPENIFSDINGKVTLFTKEQTEEYKDSGVVGTFATEKTVYLIKVESEKASDALKAFDGKVCTVSGKIRNEGKYLIIRKVELNGAEYIYKKRRGGVGM